MGMAAGDRVIFTRNLRGIGVEKNDAASIVSVDKSGKTAKLKKDDGSTVTYKFPGFTYDPSADHSEASRLSTHFMGRTWTSS